MNTKGCCVHCQDREFEGAAFREEANRFFASPFSDLVMVVVGSQNVVTEPGMAFLFDLV